MSQINTNGINTNYPVPGQNNSSQGFRDNFAQIKNGLNTASSEITDLQNKVVLKAAMNNSVLNNDMANTLISNAATSGWRSTTYNLGNALVGTVLVDVNKADVHYGTVTGNLTLQFGSWAPVNTESKVVVKLTVANTDAVISLPSQVVSSNNNYGVTILENYANISNVATVTAPADLQVLEYEFRSIDCGNTITVTPLNRPYQATQIINRDPPPTGTPGDMNGAVAVGNSVGQLTVTSTIDTGNYVIVDSTAGLYAEMPIVFTGNTDSSNSNIVAGTTYYVSNVANSTAFTITASVGGTERNVGTTSQAFKANPASYLYICTDDFNSTPIQRELTGTNVSGNITLLTTANVVVNAPVIFTGNVDTANSTLVANTVYYVKTTDGNTPGNITISRTRVNGIAGNAITLGNSNSNATATCYVAGSDIWKRVNLTSW